MVCGGPEKKWIPEANGSGAAWLDYDRDGWMDLLIVNGSNMERLRKIVSGKAPPPAKNGVYLYRNLGEGRFEDVTARSGLANPYWGTGANAADYNNDGDPDILVTTIGLDLLFRNNGDGTFTEVGKAAGLSRAVAWHTGSAFGDYDNDGHLDLYVVGYVDIAALLEADSPPVCQWKGLPVFCGPMGLKGERDILYRNFLFGLPAIENIHASASQRVQCFLREDHQLRASLSGSPKTVQSASKPSFFRQLSIPGG